MATAVFTWKWSISTWPKKSPNILATFHENFSPRAFKNRPIWSRWTHSTDHWPLKRFAVTYLPRYVLTRLILNTDILRCQPRVSWSNLSFCWNWLKRIAVEVVNCYFKLAIALAVQLKILLIKLANSWIWTRVRWCWMQQLCQLYRNNCSITFWDQERPASSVTR